MLCLGRRDNLVVEGCCVEPRDHQLDVVDFVGSVCSNRDVISNPCLAISISCDKALPCLIILCRGFLHSAIPESCGYPQYHNVAGVFQG